MNKNLPLFLRRFLVNSRHWQWLNAQTVTILVFSCFLLTAMAWTTPPPVDEQTVQQPVQLKKAQFDQSALQEEGSGTALGGGSAALEPAGSAGMSVLAAADGLANQATPEATPSRGPTVTPFPPEFAYNSQQTVGLTLTATVLVIIVVFGVLVFMPKKGGDSFS